MGIAIRKSQEPVKVPVGAATFEVRRLTYRGEMEIRARLRKAGNGVYSQEAFQTTVVRDHIVGWQGLRYDDTGEEVPYGPCPDCSGQGGPPGPPSGVNGAPCPACGGSRDCRDWLLSQEGARPILTLLENEIWRAFSEEHATAKN